MFIRFFAIVLIGLISNQAIVSATCFGVNDVTIVTPNVTLDGTMLHASATEQKIRVSYTPSADTNAAVLVKSQQDYDYWDEQPFGVKVVTADQPTPFMGGSTEATLSEGFMWNLATGPEWRDMDDQAVVTYGLVGGQEYHFYFQWAPSFLSFGFSGVCIEDDTSSKADVCTTLECGGCLITVEEDGPWKFICELPEDMSVDECGDEDGDYCPDLPVYSGTPAPVTPSPVTPSPVTPSPVTPSPVTPSPVTPSPVTPSPVTPSPVTPSPVTPSPVTPSPVTPSPVTPSPVTPSPVTPSLVTPSPVTPAPTAALTCDPLTCGAPHRGACTNGACVCRSPFTGVDCEELEDDC